MHYEIVADDLAAYLNDNRLWVEAYKHLGLFGDATRGFIPGKKAPKTSCPRHGGRSGEAFGLIHRGKLDSEATGVGVCNSCGVMSGFSIVMEETNWPFPKVLEQLAIASGYMDGITSGVFSPLRNRLRNLRGRRNERRKMLGGIKLSRIKMPSSGMKPGL
ncbi:hypothetical protein ACTG2K_21885 [Aeromonas caviae]|uniref:hypothetical protein n=1 Tax=Aeromonas caviae TaxID=648 RepID=UPI003F799AC3